MRCITGDECGLLKEYVAKGQAERDQNNKIKIENSSIYNITSTMGRQQGITSLTWMQEDAHFASLLHDGSVQVWEGNFGKNSYGRYQQVTEIPNVVTCQQALGIYRVSNRLVACSRSGEVSVVDAFKDEDNVIDSFRISESEVSLTAHAVYDTSIALGGKERETVVFDINTHQQLWKAKNLPPDPQTLLAPQVWPSCATFLDANTLVVGTAYHQVRVYDLRVANKVQQRRPVRCTDINSDTFEYRITAVTPVSDTVVAVADGAGDIHSLDIRQLTGGAISRTPTERAIRGRFAGPTGSIRNLFKHPTLDVLAAVGLDRNLYLFDAKSHKIQRVVYLKQRLNAVLMTDEEQVYDINEQDTVQDLFDSDEEPDRVEDADEGSDEEVEDSSSEGDPIEVESDEEEKTPTKRQRR